MRLMIDTNVILDVFLEREPCREVLSITPRGVTVLMKMPGLLFPEKSWSLGVFDPFILPDAGYRSAFRPSSLLRTTDAADGPDCRPGGPVLCDQAEKRISPHLACGLSSMAKYSSMARYCLPGIRAGDSLLFVFE